MKVKLFLAASAVALTGLTASSPAVAAPPKCVTVYDFPDMGLVYCYDLTGPCTVSRTQTTFFGTTTTCVVRRPV